MNALPTLALFDWISEMEWWWWCCLIALVALIIFYIWYRKRQV